LLEAEAVALFVEVAVVLVDTELLLEHLVGAALLNLQLLWGLAQVMQSLLALAVLAQPQRTIKELAAQTLYLAP
jgi:hypothetical protein